MKYSQQPISALGVVQTGSTPSTSEVKYWGGSIPFVTPAELDQNHPITIAPRTLTDEGACQSRLLQEGAVMVCCIGSLGKIGIAGRSVVTNQQINSIEFDQQKIWPKFGYYACQRLKPKLLSMAPSTTIPIINKSRFEQLEIPVPPLPEQRRIASILDQANTLRAKRRAALAQLDDLYQSIFIEMFGDPATNPKKWPLKTLKELGKVSTGGTPPGSKVGMFDGPIPFVTPGDLENKGPPRRSLTEAGAEEVTTVREGSTLVCCIGTIGKIGKASVRTAFNQQINAIEWGTEVNDNYGFLILRFFKPTISAWGASTTIPILKKSAFERLEIPVPPIEMQSKFSAIYTRLESIKDSNEASLVSLNELFHAIQFHAFVKEDL